jgi:hypothetical protein
MKVLVATSTLQGKRLTDHFHCAEGELVWMAPLCPDGRNGGGCSCRSNFVGMASGGMTTTALIVEIPALTRLMFAQAFWSGHGPECTCPVSELDIDNLLATARRWPEGAVLERNGRRLSVRGYLPEDASRTTHDVA